MESVLALGIVAVVFTSVCGVLPIAFNSYRGAMDATCRSNIVAKIGSELAQAPFSSIASNSTVTSYFGDQGVQVNEGPDARYKVDYTAQSRTEVIAQTTVDLDSLKPVTITIYPYMGAGSPANTRVLSKVTIFIADNGITAQ